MRFTEVYQGYQAKRLTQGEAARLLGVCDRSFRRYIQPYEESGLDGLLDRRINEPSLRCAPVDEVMALQGLYSTRYCDWNIRHFHRWYLLDHAGSPSYSGVKTQLQKGELAEKGKRRGPHRKKRLPAALLGMMINQDGSTHQWVPGQYWDLIVTMDDATNEHYSMRFVQEEGTHSSLLEIKEVLQSRGLFCSFYSDRGSHYWHTPDAGGKVDKPELALMEITEYRQSMITYKRSTYPLSIQSSRTLPESKVSRLYPWRV